MQITRNQEEAIEHLNRWKVGALFMEAGTGKTRVACELARSTDADAILYVAPLRTLGNATAEVEKWWRDHPNIMYVGIESIGQSDRIFFDVVNFCECNSKTFIIMDESVKIKNFSAKRTRRAMELAEKCEYRLILNGTPITRNILDLWAQMQFLSPKILNMSEARFVSTFCKVKTVTKYVPGRPGTSRSFISGHANEDYLYSLIRQYVYECSLDIGVEKVYSKLNYVVGSDESEEYERLKKHYLSEDTLDRRSNNIFLEMTSAMQHCYCTTQGKFDAIDGVVGSVVNEEDCIIFCRFVRSIEECAKRYPRAKVLSYQKEALGLNLQQYSVTFFFDKVWDYALMEQATRRTYRMGQTRGCRYYDLTGNVKLEALFDKCIDKKVSVIQYFKEISKQQIDEEI